MRRGPPAWRAGGRSTRPNVSKRPRGSIPWQKSEPSRLWADLETPEELSNDDG